MFPVTCQAKIQKLGSVGRLFWGFLLVVVGKRDFVQEMVKKCENSVFRVIFCKNIHMFLLGLMPLYQGNRSVVRLFVYLLLFGYFIYGRQRIKNR